MFADQTAMLSLVKGVASPDRAGSATVWGKPVFHKKRGFGEAPFNDVT
jgi:hypothetical protein